MNFHDIKNNNASADIPYFELDKGNDVLKDARSCHKYEAYQQMYKKVCGVMPELDKIHNPVCAIIRDNVFMPDDIQKNRDKSVGSSILGVMKNAVNSGVELASGHVGGALAGMGNAVIEGASGSVGTEHYWEFKRAFNDAIEKYKYEYSLLCSYDLSFINGLDVGEYFPKDNLGYRKTEDGTYYEGTWQNGELLYGLMRASNGSFVFVGSFDGGCTPDEGVMFDGAHKMGLFKNYELNCLHGIQICTDVSFEDLTLDYFIEVGGFEDGHENGEVIRYMQQTSGNVMIFKDKFDYGDIVQPGLIKSIIDKVKSGIKKAGRRFLRIIEVICYICGGAGIISMLLGESSAIGATIVLIIIAIVLTVIRKRK